MGANQVERERKRHGGNLILVLFIFYFFLFFFILCFFLLISFEFHMVIICSWRYHLISLRGRTWYVPSRGTFFFFPSEYIYIYIYIHLQFLELFMEFCTIFLDFVMKQ